MKKLSIVVPCYNEQETIYPFLEETQKMLLTKFNKVHFWTAKSQYLLKIAKNTKIILA